MLIRNDKNEHVKVINNMFNNAHEVYIMVAFLKLSGLHQVKSYIENILKDKGSVKAIVGLDLYVTEPKALHELFALTRKKRNLKLFLYENESTTFHPKIYLAKNNSRSSILIGSANLTNGGLSSNIEASYYAEDDPKAFDECKELFFSLTSEPHCINASIHAIEAYQQKYFIFDKEITRAKKASKKKIEEIGESSLLLDCYLEYCQNSEQVNGLIIKRGKYKKAKGLIKQFTNGSIKSKADFMAIYELLVGASGKQKLWHSDGIYRAKNIVAENYIDFIEFVTLISNKTILRKSPFEIFELALPVKKKIKGLGFNVITELLTTLDSHKFPVLNKNPISSIEYLLGKQFKEADTFKSEDYQAYSEFMTSLCDEVGAEDFIETDHFLNFVYWKYAKQ